LNKIGAKQGAIDAKKQAELRKNTDARVPEAKIGAGRDKKLPPNEFAFGKPNRPSTPINGVISNFYGESAENDQKVKYDVTYQVKKSFKPLPAAKETKAVQKAKEFKQTTKIQHDSPDKKEFKLKRFQDVQPRTNTYKKPFAAKAEESKVEQS
jgi:hypothetical protein